MTARRAARQPDLAQARRRFLSMRLALATLAAGSALAVAVFAVLWRGAAGWLEPTAAEGLVFSASVLGLAVVMLGLNAWYVGRPTRGVEPVPAVAPGGVGRGGLAVLAVCAAVTGALLWSEHRHAASWAASRAQAGTLDRALFGQVQAPFAGVAGTLTIVVATFLAVALVRGRGA